MVAVSQHYSFEGLFGVQSNGKSHVFGSSAEAIGAVKLYQLQPPGLPEKTLGVSIYPDSVCSSFYRH